MKPTSNPILNNPFAEPTRHFQTDGDGSLNPKVILPGRRAFSAQTRLRPASESTPPLGFGTPISPSAGDPPVNRIRETVKNWRENGYPGITRVTEDLFRHWFDPERHEKLFFAQREALETAVWLNEIAEKSEDGRNTLRILEEANEIPGAPRGTRLPRTAFKMATGTGKTVVMAGIMLYHYLNRKFYRNDVRFADCFLVITPGLTIRDRLDVLVPDDPSNAERPRDYYRVRNLVPPRYADEINGLASKIAVLNWHSLQRKQLSGKHVSPFDKAGGGALESFSQLVRRTLPGFKRGSRLVVINDEAHHCYLPNPVPVTRPAKKKKGKADEEWLDDEPVDKKTRDKENESASVWFNGIVEIGKIFKLDRVYDLSATPYYLNGSGYEPYRLFPWTVSDFNLAEAIESGLVKIPFLPTDDDSIKDGTGPKLLNLHRHIRDDLPKPSSKSRLDPQPPPLLKTALEKLYRHYEAGYEKYRGLFGNPPVFIVVCNNTAVADMVYRYVAGYEKINQETGEVSFFAGKFALFSNFDEKTGEVRKPPTLLVDSNEMSETRQLEKVKKDLAPEIETFRREYAVKFGAPAAQALSDEVLLREAMNTVGKSGRLGAHIRCVVSVSMLTEGWDVNTVTHVCGVRAFGSLLLCEQVAGRALRRNDYTLHAFDKRTGEPIPPENRHKFNPENVLEAFQPEYAHIVGIPFDVVKADGAEYRLEPKPLTQIFPVPERQQRYEIRFPKIVGYRIEAREGEITADFSGIENFVLDGAKLPTKTMMGNAFSPESQLLDIEHLKNVRRQTLVYGIAHRLIKTKLYDNDEDRNPRFGLFPYVVKIVETWLDTKLELRGNAFVNQLLIADENAVCEHIHKAIDKAGQKDGRIAVLPEFDYYNREVSTGNIRGSTSKPTFPTKHSHLNHAVCDTLQWEQALCQTLEELAENGTVRAYVKNAFGAFQIPYAPLGHEHERWETASEQDRIADKLADQRILPGAVYEPDFIVACTPDGKEPFNLIIELTGFNKKHKTQKKWFVEHRWIPAVQSVAKKYGFPQWRFLEIAGEEQFLNHKNIITNLINNA